MTWSICKVRFYSYIVNEEYSGATISFLHSVSNFGSQWTGSAALYLLSYLDYDLMIYVSWFIIIFYYYIMKDKISNLQYVENKDWLNKDDDCIIFKFKKYNQMILTNKNMNKQNDKIKIKFVFILIIKRKI